MKHLLFFLTIFYTLPNISNAQIIAYPAENTSRSWGSQCVDIRFTDPVVIGYQIDVSVNYYISLADAQDESNPLDRYYEPISNPQIIYARVSSNTSNDFAVSDITISWSTTFPPAGISPCDYMLCDIDTDGSEMVYLDKLKCAHNSYTLDATFCSSADNEIETTYYLSEDDAINEVSAINNNYLITETTTIYSKLKNTTTNQFYIDGYITIELVTCTLDTDNDGIPDGAEDPNRNLVNDDDTDQDSIRNFQDNDDDGDGILTIDEDYNNNGDPTDDDTNGNNIPDYLEANVTLSINNHLVNDSFIIYPNPASDVIHIQSTHPIYSVTIYNNIGQIVLVEKNKTSINVSKYSTGLFFMKLQDTFGNIVIKKIVKE